MTVQKCSALWMLLVLTIPLLLSCQLATINPPRGSTASIVSARTCPANCQFCQINNNQCITCREPYFISNGSGGCILVQNYMIESAREETEPGDIFRPSNSWQGVTLRKCSPDLQYFTDIYSIIEPNNPNSPLIYSRTVSPHKYLLIRFQVLRMGWSAGSSLNIVVRNQDTVLSRETITFNDYAAPSEKMCSNTAIDQRISVEYLLQDTISRQITITFTPSLSPPSRYGINTFILLSGRCDTSCGTCEFSVSPNSCITCTNFLSVKTAKTCDGCETGFKLGEFSVGRIPRCIKCPIEQETCDQTVKKCAYLRILGTDAKHLDATCNFLPGSPYSAEKYVTEDQFFGSLFQVGNRFSNFQCLPYSIVGLARSGQSISREFLSVRNHYMMSIMFNIFVVDKPSTVLSSLFGVLVNGVLVDTQLITLTGSSSVCGSEESIEVFKSYPATRFFAHTSTKNVNVTIISDAANWGIRDLQLSYKVCDQTCLKCTTDGCLECPGLFQLSNLQCSACLSGYGAVAAVGVAPTCRMCPANCLQCVSDPTRPTAPMNCTSCQTGYFLFSNNCQRHPNIGLPATASNPTWLPVFTSPTYPACSFTLSGQPPKNFILGEGYLTRTYKLPDDHWGIKISFYLIKIDNWDPKDELHLFINDLLVISKSYSSLGNSICFKPDQRDFISFQQTSIRDENKTVKIELETVNGAVIVKRQFGISDFTVSPVGCSQCRQFPFEFKVDYDYSTTLDVIISFNRVYRNINTEQFSKIFKVEVNNNEVSYKMVSNDTLRYHLETNFTGDVIGKGIKVTCLHRNKVVTNIFDEATIDPVFRILQQQKAGNYNSLKILDAIEAKVNITRFSPVQSKISVERLQLVVSVISYIVVFISFIFFFLGLQTICIHTLHNFQKIFLHVFIGALSTPTILRSVLLAFEPVQKISVIINQQAWRSLIPQQLYYNVPSVFPVSTVFLTNIIDIGFGMLVLAVFYLICFLVASSLGENYWPQSNLWRHFRVSFYHRPFFFFNSVIFYQYLALCLACYLQFIDGYSHTNIGIFSQLSYVGAIIAFVFACLYPIGQFLYLSRRSAELTSREQEIVYRNGYHEIFFRFNPRKLWRLASKGFTPIGVIQHIYSLWRYAQIWWLCLVAALLYESPFAQCFLFMMTTCTHLVLVLFGSINYTRTFKFLKLFELCLFAALQVLQLVAVDSVTTIDSSAFNVIGIVGVVLVVLIMALSLLRSMYTAKKILAEYATHSEKVKIRVDERLRDEKHYNSLETIGETNRKIESVED